MPRQQAISVQILNQTYHLGTSEDRDPQYIKRAAEYLDAKMREAAGAVGHRAPLHVAILAALNIAEEVLQARRSKDTLLDEADERIDSFARRLADEDRRFSAEDGGDEPSQRRF